MKNFEAAIFDMDGLLLDSERLAFETFQDTCEDLKTGDLSVLFKSLLGTNSELGEALLKEGLKEIVDYTVFCKLWDEKYSQLTDSAPIPLKKGVLDLLEHFTKCGLPMAVATSTATGRAKSKLKSSGITDYFRVIVGGDQVSKSKPNPDIYLRAAAELSCNPTRCLAFEDSANGVKAAVAAEMTVIQIPDLVQPDKELMKLGHIVLSNLAEVIDYRFTD